MFEVGDTIKILGKAGRELSVTDISVLKIYVDFRITIQAAAESTVTKDLYYICIWRRHISAESFELITTDDIITAISAMRRKYKVNTFNSVWKSVKMFLRWYIKKYGANIDIAVLNSVKLTKSPPTITAADIISKDDIMIISNECCTNPRDRALLWLLYDSYGRATETALNLTWGDFVFDRRGIKLNLAGKTKRPRYIRLTKCNQYLLAWRADYWGGNPEGAAPVFLKRGYKNQLPEPLSMTTLYDIFRKWMALFYKKTGRKIKLHPHLFRHTGITHDIADGLPLSYVSMKAWGVPSSPQILNYVHLTGGDTDKILFEHLGIEEPGELNDVTAPVQCPHCKVIVSPGFKFCPECGERLVSSAPVRAEDMSEEEEEDYLNTLLKNKKLLARALMKLSEDTED